MAVALIMWRSLCGCSHRTTTALAMILISVCAAAGEPLRLSCPDLRNPVAVRVEAVLDAQTLRIEGGQEVRLAAVQQGAADDAGVVDEIGRLVQPGVRVDLYRASEGLDRYGRLVAHVAVSHKDKVYWLQEKLIAAGLARAYRSVDTSPCLAALLRVEDKARAARAGLWASGHLQVYSAHRPELLEELADTFQIVQGRVVSVGHTKRAVYVNFGHVWKRDFTVIIPPRRERSFVAAGIVLSELKGKHVRVRGWVEQRGGPAITLDDPVLMEIIE